VFGTGIRGILKLLLPFFFFTTGSPVFFGAVAEVDVATLGAVLLVVALLSTISGVSITGGTCGIGSGCGGAFGLLGGHILSFLL
jgi:hypothetical protein